MATRMTDFLALLNKEGIDSALVTSTANFYYLSNYYTDPHERVIAVYVAANIDPVLLLPAMEANDAKACGWEFEIIGYYDHEDPWQLLLQYLEKNGKVPQSVAMEQDHITLERYKAIKGIFPDVEIFDAKEMLANLRVIKTKKEYTLLKEAAALADFGVKTGVEAIKEGVSELALVAQIEYELKKQGVQQMSFSTMALSGAKTASPHGTPSSKEITSGDLVLFDLGVVYEGYCSDITRTVAFQSITEEQRKIYDTVLAAEQHAINASTLGTPVGKIDKAARDTIANAGFGEYFTHRIGHGLGIETHEYPSMHANNETALQPGMCYTIEPGIYIPNVGGVRIEDMIFTTDKGAEVLTKFPKELVIVG
ncbi:M24 family metallopeptidase [Oceanobacillus bengalensis]|uniref:Aminopeptidase P family protein n=1 Tax=Oceanobacillus bengalensis TaxID=1435466 RepID=A0A494YWW7_9BACI|nr:Xaa-Pro peptidase family protein [Oceanobacillus bengalensis]RKQ14642.1 aminopeptidase P family protein [Oceanobacillus bengalensis]